MQTLMSTLDCPQCGEPATLTKFGPALSVVPTDPIEIEFACSARCQVPEKDLARLWAEGLG